MALGTSEATPLQVASAYTAFANLGTRTSSMAINRITTGDGVTIAAPTAQRSEVMRPDVAYVMNSFMKDVVNRGTAAKVRARGLKANVAGKTGTSRDGWFAGFTPNLVCVVWVGFDDGSQLGLTGANSALPIWTDFMQVALSEHPEWQGDWQMPEGIQQADIDPTTGQLTTPDNPIRRTELFINGTLPTPPTVEEPEEEATPDGPRLMGRPFLTPEILGQHPSFPRQPTPRPRPEPRSEPVLRLEGSITLDIDPSTGLIAVETCPVIRTKTFVIGTEPRTYCGPEYHRGKTVDPAVSRPRVVATPPR